MRSTLFFPLLACIIVSCSSEPEGFKFLIQNNSDFERKTEIVEIPLSEIKGKFRMQNQLIAENLTNGKTYKTQIGRNHAGIETAVLFQPEVAANETSRWMIRNAKEDESITDSINHCYSRFVPERIDDYAWENDKVAFRTYGPEAQRLIDEGQKGGTKSSGIDCWFKKVNYPIIDKWYKKVESGGSYHKDDGEGYDNYHVGISRGCGGTGIFDSENKILYTSGNFKAWEKIQDGKLRCSFKLNYGEWKAAEKTVSEIKHISLDKGSNLVRYDFEIKGTDVLTVGITLHDKKGDLSVEPDLGWFNYWEPNGESMVATAIVAHPKNVIGYEELIKDEQDESHILVHLKVQDNKVSFYSGFFWEASQQFASLEEWQMYLKEFSNQITNPLVIKL